MNILKRFFAAAAAAVMLCAAAMPVCAESDWLYDAAGVFTETETESIGKRLDEINAEYGIDAAVFVINSLGGGYTAQAADELQEEYCGSSGILLLISVSDRKYHMTTNGSCIRAFTDRTLDYMAEDIEYRLRDDDYYGAAQSFAAMTDDVLADYADGKGYSPKFKPSVTYVVSVLGIALLAAAVAAWIAKRSMNDAVTPDDADMYVRSGTAKIKVSRDIFLYSTIIRHEKPRDNAGGSSTHRSSGGGIHGGRGGRF